jgi:riboflavin synthase
MFTGIIEAQGRIARVEPRGGDCRMLIEAAGFLRGVAVGDSIAVNGVCLTAAEITDDSFVADLSTETLAATTAKDWKLGATVNLERALTPAKPLGGHLVSGHVDGVGRLAESHDDGRGRRMVFEAPAALARYIARKGSVCVDGVSLTVNAVAGSRFELMVIPHTLSHTTLGALKPGAAVNLEVDLIARYLERLLMKDEQ